MDIFLGGGGSVDEERPTLSSFFESTSTGGKVLLIPVARKRAYRYRSAVSDWVKRELVAFSREFEICFDLGEMAPQAADQYSGIFLGGGNTFDLVSDLNCHGWSEAVVDFAQHSPIYGGSAGAIVMGSNISNCIHYDENLVGLDDFQGLDLIGASVWCHLDEAARSKAVDHAVSEGDPLVALPRDGGLHFDGSNFVSIGRGQSLSISVDGAIKYI